MPRDFRPSCRPAAALLTLTVVACALAAPSPAAGQDPASAGAPPSNNEAVRFGQHNIPAWPIYVKWDWEDGRSLRVFGPVTSWYREPGYFSAYPVFPVTGVRRWHGGRSSFRALWPVLYSDRDPDRGSWSLNLATPLLSVRSERGPGYRDLSFLPLYYSHRAPEGRRATMLVPFRRRVEQSLGHRLDETWGFVPLWTEPLFWLYRGWRNEHGHGWNSAWFYGAWTADSSRNLSLPPWVSFDHRFEDGQSSRLHVLVPVYGDYHRRAPLGVRLDARNVLLLHHTYSEVKADGDSNRMAMTLPFHYGRSDTKQGRATGYEVVLPLYASWRSPESRGLAGLPSWWSYRSNTLASRGFWPFYASFERTRPDSSERRGASIAWPLVTWGSGEEYSAFGLLPFWFGVRDGDTRFAALIPFYWDLHKPEHATRVVVPVYYGSRGPTDTTKVLTLWYRYTKPGYRHSGFFPLYDRGANADTGYSIVLPLLSYHSWSPEKDSRWIALIWGDWRSKVDGSRTRLIGPVLTTRGPGTSGFGILPVYYSTRGPESSRTLLGPVFTSRDRGDRRNTVIVPLSWHRSSPQGWAIDLLPLSGYRSHKDGRRSMYVVGPVYTWRVHSAEKRSSALLWWLYRDDVDGEKHRSMLQPVYYFDRKTKDDVFFSVLGGLIGSYERLGPDRQVKVLFIPVRRWSS